MRCIRLLALSIVLFVITSVSFADQTTKETDVFRHPFYVGVMGGFGSTTWEGLVPTKENQNDAIGFATPKYVNEGGAAGGVFIGYEIIPTFALEASYMRYPKAKISFDDLSLFSFDHDGQTDLITSTEAYTVMAKLMLIIPHTDLRAYSGLGVSDVHRSDQIADQWRISPTFTAGFSYNFTPHIMAEIGASYTAGYGEAELEPSKDYFPFLYAVFLRLAYRF